MMSEYPQDGSSVSCCYDYHIDAQLQNCLVHYVLRVIGCVMAGTWQNKGTHKMLAAGKMLMASIVFFSTFSLCRTSCKIYFVAHRGPEL